ncbi:MAG TPA: PDZ domain-containing protein [Acidimicrobiales bacterium]|nr:PDZ domain-containing protein [Acidimicrobiales bacterium]
MDSGGPLPFGDFPDEPGIPGLDADPDAPLRGWLPPEDRLWRHPSERAASAFAAAAPTATRPGHRWTALTVGVLGAVVVAGVAIALTSGTSSPTRATTGFQASDTSLVTAAPSVQQVMRTMQRSLVVVRPAGSSGGVQATGVVLPGGTLIMTAAAAVAKVQQVDVVDRDGKRHGGTVAGVDDHTGVAVIVLDDALSPASFADEAVSPHEVALTACMCGAAARGTAVTPEIAVGMVQQVGTALRGSAGTTMLDAIAAETPLGPDSWGSVLLDDTGHVLGILGGLRSGNGDTVGYFVPSQLAVGVADELAKDHKITHGWLGVVCTDAADGGAAITTVMSGSPAAAAGLVPGDVVEAVDGHPVASLADLQARLYTAKPGSVLVLTVERGSSSSSVPVTVDAGPS